MMILSKTIGESGCHATQQMELMDVNTPSNYGHMLVHELPSGKHTKSY